MSWERWESSKLGRWRSGKLVSWERWGKWEGSAVARSERWEGSEVASRQRWEVVRWQGGKGG